MNVRLIGKPWADRLVKLANEIDQAKKALARDELVTHLRSRVSPRNNPIDGTRPSPDGVPIVPRDS